MKDKLTLFGKGQDPLRFLIVEETVLKDSLSEIQTLFAVSKDSGLQHFPYSKDVHWVLDNNIIVYQSPLFLLNRFSEFITVKWL